MFACRKSRANAIHVVVVAAAVRGRVPCDHVLAPFVTGKNSAWLFLRLLLFPCTVHYLAAYTAEHVRFVLPVIKRRRWHAVILGNLLTYMPVFVLLVVLTICSVALRQSRD